MRRGEIWWANLPEPKGSDPGYRRPVLVMQDDSFNTSAIRTVIVLALTKNLKLSAAPGNVLLPKAKTGLKLDSVANVSQIVTLDKAFLEEKLGDLSGSFMREVEEGLRLVLGL